MPTYTATYLTTYTFHIPKDVVLIKEEDLHKYQDEPGVWWVKWGTFYYIDKNGEQQEIQGDKSSDKWPDHMEEPEEVISKCFYCYRIGAWYRCSANDPFSDEPCACGVTIKTSAAMEAEKAEKAEEAKEAEEDDEDAIDYSKLNHIKTTPGGVEIYA